MKPLFKNISIYNSKNYNQFVKFHNKKFSFSYNMYTITMFVLLIYCMILNIVQRKFLLILLFLGLIILWLLLRIYLPSQRYKKTKKQYAKNKESKVSFSFYKFNFTIEKKSFYYFNLYKVFETKDCFYLYINEEHAAIVNKNSFEIGTAEEFSEFIKKKCLFKYRKQV